MVASQGKGRGKEAERGIAVKTAREAEGRAEKDLYTADTWSLLIAEPCDRPLGVLWSSVRLSLPASALVCLCGCRHAVCVSRRVKYVWIGSGVCVCTWTSLCLAFLQANKLRWKMTIRLEWGAGRNIQQQNACFCVCFRSQIESVTPLDTDFNTVPVLQVCAFRHQIMLHHRQHCQKPISDVALPGWRSSY